MARNTIERGSLIEELKVMANIGEITTVEQLCYENRYSRTTGNKILHSDEWEQIKVGKQFFYVKR